MWNSSIQSGTAPHFQTQEMWATSLTARLKPRPFKEGCVKPALVQRRVRRGDVRAPAEAAFGVVDIGEWQGGERGVQRPALDGRCEFDDGFLRGRGGLQ